VPTGRAGRRGGPGAQVTADVSAAGDVSAEAHDLQSGQRCSWQCASSTS